MRVRLRVVPSAGRSQIVGRYGQGWKVRVGAPPERGRANEAVLVLIAETLDVDRGQVVLVAGASSRDKVVEVQGIEAARADELLSRRAGKGDG